MSDRIAVGDRWILTGQTDQLRFHHVTKHLFAPRERWWLIVPGLSHQPRAQARRCGCVYADLGPNFWWERVSSTCREHVLAKHEASYLPAALDAVATGDRSGRQFGVRHRNGAREIILGDNAVQVVLGLPNTEWEQAFYTAYRDAPHGPDPTNAEFLARAVRKLRDKASLGSGGAS